MNKYLYMPIINQSSFINNIYVAHFFLLLLLGTNAVTFQIIIKHSFCLKILLLLVTKMIVYDQQVKKNGAQYNHINIISHCGYWW